MWPIARFVGHLMALIPARPARLPACGKGPESPKANEGLLVVEGLSDIEFDRLRAIF